MSTKTLYKPVSISLPKEVLDRIDIIARESYKSRSDVIREAVIDRAVPTYEPTTEETKALNKARKQINKGETTNWNNFIKDELENRNIKLY